MVTGSVLMQLRIIVTAASGSTILRRASDAGAATRSIEGE